MQRWHITAGLSAAAVLAALVVPALTGTPTFTLTPLAPPEATPPPQPLPDANPAAEGLLTLSAQLDQSALLQRAGEDRYLVVEVTAPDLAGDVRRPVHVAVVMDVSGSMAGRGKIDNARQAASELVSLLGPEDSYSLVTFSDTARTLIPSTTVERADLLQRTIRGIEPQGGTNLYDGMVAGMAQLESGGLGGVRRVVLLSDGIANIGVTDTAALARAAGSGVDSGVTVSALGLGLEYNEDLLAAMSDAGGGRYRFVDRPGQLSELFVEELQQMTRVAGREALVSVSLGSGVVIEEVYGYPYARTGDGFQVLLGDVHGGETRKVVARVRVPDQVVGPLDVASVDLRYRDPDTEVSVATRALAAAVVTPDAERAHASVNKPAAVQAGRAVTSSVRDRGAQALADGDQREATELLRNGADLLRKARVQYDAPELEAEIAEVAAQAASAPMAEAGSEEALFQVKRAKETARDYAH